MNEVNDLFTYQNFFFFFNIYLFIWLHQVLVAARMWDLVPLPGIEPRPPTLGPWSLNHCATREVPRILKYTFLLSLSSRAGWFMLYGSLLSKYHLFVYLKNNFTEI